jgi:hypothetical protein
MFTSNSFVCRASFSPGAKPPHQPSLLHTKKSFLLIKKILHTKNELTPENAEALTKWLKNGSEVMWKGIFPPSITHILKNMGMHASKVSTWPDKIRDMLLDGATSIWKARCKEVHDDTNLEEDPKVIAKREKGGSNTERY